MKIKRGLFLSSLIIVISSFSFVYSYNISYETFMLKKRTDSYSVKKHLDLAKQYADKNMDVNFTSEIRVLKEIDPQHAAFYEKVLNDTIGPAGVFLDISEKSGYSREENNILKSAAADYRDSRIQDAQDKLEKILRINPDNNSAKMFMLELDEEVFEKGSDELFTADAESVFNKAMIYYRKGMYETSDDFLQSAFEIDPMSVSIRRFIKLSTQVVSAEAQENTSDIKNSADNYERSDNIDKARRAYENAAIMGDKKAKAKIAEYHEKSAELAKQAEELMKQGKVKEAYLKNIEALDYDPDNKKAQDVKSELKGYISDSEASGLVSDVAKKALLDGDTDKARVMYEKAAAMGDKNAVKTINELNSQSADMASQAALLNKQGNSKEAYLAAVKALELNPDNEKAAKLLEGLKKTIPQNVAIDLIYNQGVDYYLKNDYHRALESWNNVISISPDDVQTKKNIEKASVNLENQTEKDKKDADDAYNQGLVFMDEGLMEKARNRFEYVLRLVPEDTAASKKLAEVNKKMDVQYDKNAVIKR